MLRLRGCRGVAHAHRLSVPPPDEGEHRARPRIRDQDDPVHAQSDPARDPRLRNSASEGLLRQGVDFDYSPEATGAPPKEEFLWKQPTGDPMMMKDQFCVVLWNDDKHSFDEVIQLLMDLTGRTREDASIVADNIDEHGREVIEMNSNIPRLLEIGQAIQQIDLGVTIRRAYDTFREQVSAVIIEWLLDLTRSRLGSDILIIREIIAGEMLSPRKPTYSRGFTDAHPFIRDVSDPARLDWLLLYHVRLWKKPRLNLKEVYAALLSLSHDHKLAMGMFIHCSDMGGGLTSSL
jgi:E3 ubiquitin-protein ligase UBR1